MCACNPQVRTLFCGVGACVPPNQNVRPLVPWHDVTPLALVQQLQARIEEHQDRGEEHVILAMRAFRKPGSEVWTYQPYWSRGQAEVLYMMCHEIEGAVMRRERRSLLGLAPES